MVETLTALLTALQALSILLANNPQSASMLTTTTIALPAIVTPQPTTLTDINDAYKDAVFNMLCKGQGALRSGSASGVFITPNGIGLINAHIGQYLLLGQMTDAPISCIIRTGSPAVDTYTAELLYIPPAWITKNGAQIVEKVQYGTGEDDYALIRVTGTVYASQHMPTSFPHLAPDVTQTALTDSEKVVIRAYPAELISSRMVMDSLYAAATIADVHEFTTFKATTTNATIDLFSLGGTRLSQGGSSGGAVMTQHSTLAGLVVTSTREDTTAERNLKAITLSYINESLKKQSGKDLATFIATPMEELRSAYHDSLVTSAQHLADTLNK